MARNRGPTTTIERVGRLALRLFRLQAHVSLHQLAEEAAVSKETAKRTLEWLRDVRKAPIEYVALHRSWALTEATFALPLMEPSLDDLQATLTAAGLLAELGQDVSAARARSLFDELAEQLSGEKNPGLHREALRVSQTTATIRDPRWVMGLLRAVRRQVVRLRYRSPWATAGAVHTVEPWQLWLHDGVLYLRGYSRTRRGPRTFRLANVEHFTVVAGETPRQAIPGTPWSDEDPRLGIDFDRPGSATIRLEGAVARWVAAVRWHPDQQDRWLEPDEVLERQLPYRSCREFVRRLASVADGITRVEPEELKSELRKFLAVATHALK